jgi:hypothetical protein
MLISIDVASYYPSLMVRKGLFPRSYGDTGAAAFREILEGRLEIKQRAKSAVHEEERRRLRVQETGLKLILNSTFGNFNNPYSTLFDPTAFLGVTLTGQIMLIDLIERLTEAGVLVISANTDGLYLRVRRDDRRWREIIEGWQHDTEMILEIEPLRRLVTFSTNRFATLDRSGNLKRRGAGVKGNLTAKDTPNNLVVADAVVEAVLRDVPPERTIRACADPVRFCSVTQRSAKVVSAVLIDDGNGSEIDLPKIARWYHARDSARRIVHHFADGRHTTPARATGINLALDLSDGRLPADLDVGWYIGQARKVVQSVPGYRHRSRKRLQDHPAALELVARGLVPVPKWAGKAQPRASDRAQPTYLWDWACYTTFGTYTGPAVGILVLDLDAVTKFRLWVDHGNFPLLADRWRDLDGCLVSCRGDATPEDVRTGRARGKLIFRLEGDDTHPLARMRQAHWLKSHGVEVFYSHGMPAVLGQHPDGTAYRLDGTLGAAPEWLITLLTPKRRLQAPKALPRTLPSPSPNGRHEKPAVPVEVDPVLLDGLPKILADLAPELGRGSVGWRRKELGDGRTIYIGRCPFEHDSGTSTDGDLSAGYDPDGRPYVRCMHATCTEVPAIDVRLKEAVRPATAPAAEVPPLEPTAIAQSMVRDLEDHLVSFHHAPTGSGKSYGVAQSAVVRYRIDLATLIAVPTIRVAKETMERLAEMAPDAVAADAIAPLFGRRPASIDGENDQDGDSDGDDSGTDSYPVHPWTRIIVCTHAQLLRRGFSRFLRAIWPAIEATDDAEHPRPAFALIVDEAGELIRACRWEIPLAHRVTLRRDPDGSGGVLVPLKDCPRQNRSGNCANCTLIQHGGEMKFNRFGIRELAPPRSIEVDSERNWLRTPRLPLVVDDADAGLGIEVRVGTTTFAKGLYIWLDKAINESTRRTADVYLYRRDKDGGQEPETPKDILGHMLDYAFRPVVTWEKPINEEGEPVSPDTLKYRIEHPANKHIAWDDGIIFPLQTCNVPRLRFADLAGLEQMRRFAADEHVGIVFAGAMMTTDDDDVLREVWPRMVRRDHPYPLRKIHQAAVAFVEDHHGIGALVDGGRLVTAPLEAFGLGLVFCATRRVAKALYDAVRLDHPSVRLADENDEVSDLRRTLHKSEELRCYVTYSRGVLGLGANIEGIRFLVVDALAFRSVASFTPEDITPEEFKQSQAEERLVLILQNLGRALRGEAGKTVVLIVLNADEHLQEVLRAAPAIIEGSELPPAIAHGEDLPQLVDQARRWLESGGGKWPEPDPATAKPKRAGGRPKRSKESVLKAAEAAIKDGEKWREFARREHPERVLTAEELHALKARFGED